MKNLVVLSLISVLSLSSYALAENDSFDFQAETILNKFDLILGQDQSIKLPGTLEGKSTRCEVTVYNRSKISESFPDSSRASQRLQITIQYKASSQINASNFKFDRTSEVVEFSESARVGATVLNVVAHNRTGIGEARMNQSLRIAQIPGRKRTLKTQVSDFHGKSVICVTAAP